jgi:glutathione S-transferase
MSMKLYATPNSYMTKKVLIAARYSGLSVECSDMLGNEAGGKTAVLETPQGCVFSSGAIARYISRISRVAALYGDNLIDGGAIDSWLEFSTHEFEVPLCTWILAANGNYAESPEVMEFAKNDVKKALAILNNHLLCNTYMVGHKMSLADISIACALFDGMKNVLNEEIRAPFVNLMRWFDLCIAQPEFSSVLAGEVLAKAPPKEAAPKAADPSKAKAAEAKVASSCGEAKITEPGDEIRALKEQLKGEGVTGKKINDHPEVKKLVAQLHELKSQGAAGPPLAPAAVSPPVVQEEKGKKDKTKKAEEAPKEKGKKDKGKKAEEAPKEEPKEPTAEELAEQRKQKIKRVVKEGGKRGVEIEGAADMGGLQFFCTSVDEPEGDIEMLGMCMDAMNAECKPTDEERKGGSGNIGKMIFSAGTDQLAVVAYLPGKLLEQMDAKDWLEKVLSVNDGTVLEGSTSSLAQGVIKLDADKGRFPLKMKEPSIQEAINFLKSKGLFPDCDSDDDDDYVFGDDDFPSM